MSHNLEGSMLSDSSSSRRKKRGWVDDMMEAENTPGDVIHQWSPTHKQLCLHPREKENDAVPFVLSRRSRRRKETSSGLSWDHLPDELILRILFCLPLSNLLRTSLVCKRWRRLAFDESLWHSVDLDGVTNMAAALELLLTAGVRRLRCPRTFIQDLHPVHVVQMDLSNCNISAETLEVMLSRCSALTHLSLEGLELSDRILHHLSQNPEMIELNMGGCAGFSPEPLGRMLQSFSKLERLNISWCEFSLDHVKAVVGNLSSSITELNLSGYRENFAQEDLEVLVERCPDIVTLDISDSVFLRTTCIPTLQQLMNLKHLSLSRCYQIYAAALGDVGEKFTALRLLDAFGLIPDPRVFSKTYEIKHIAVNTRAISMIARPTPVLTDVHSMWDYRCRLRFHY
ncbi:S-phase kinase-associated protein 2 [Merluccius polli]|uniref:S-phase kinase-associated protein 2 n=1 Tax=Merluccius polli TaxID=89951 RepID=A0AA47N9G4_MERPO|nr:S-phase kinase-associated protein 2 [Merluccius polli]